VLLVLFPQQEQLLYHMHHLLPVVLAQLHLPDSSQWKIRLQEV
jgi:hypothetical protein